MTIDRRVSYIIHSTVEKYRLKKIRDAAIKFSSFLLSGESKYIVIKDRYNSYNYLNTSNSDSVDSTIYYTGVYAPGVISVIQFLVNKGDVLIDIGGHNTTSIIRTSLKAGKTGNVYIFTSDYEQIHKIRCNNSLNKLKNVKIIDSELSDITTQITANEDGKVRKLRILDNSYHQLGITNCSVMYINTLNGQMHVLRGARGFIFKFRPLICFKINSNNNPESLYNILSQFPFYKVFQLEHGDNYNSKLREVVTFNDIQLNNSLFCLTNDHISRLNFIIAI